MSHSHDHTHNHSHDHHHPAPQSFNIAFAIAVILNLGFTAGEAGYALLANSMSLLADAAHNLGDVLGLLLAWGANWLLTRPAKKRYSYGYKRTSILAALANTLILVATSALIAYEAIRKFNHLTEINSSLVIIVALVGIFINGGTALLFFKGADHDLNIKGAFLHLMGDALIALGVVATGIIIAYTNQIWIDPLVSLIIVCIILWGSWGLLRDSLSLILDAVPRYIDLHGIQEFLQKLPGVKAIHDLHIWGLSTKEMALTAHLVMPDAILTDQDYEKINAILKEKFRIDHATLQVEKGSMDYPCQRTEIC